MSEKYRINKSILIKMILILVCLITISTLSILIKSSRLKQEYELKVLEINEQVSESIEDKLEDVLATLKKLSSKIEVKINDGVIYNTNIDEVNKIIQEYTKTTIFEEIYLIDKDGYVLFNEEKKYIGDNEHIKKSIDGEENISPMMKNSIDNEMIVNFTIPIIIEGKIVGVLGGIEKGMDFENYLLNNLYDNDLEYDVYVFDDQHNLIIYNYKDTNIKPYENKIRYSDINNIIKNNEKLNIRQKDIFKNRIWHVVTVIENKKITESIENKIKIYIIMCICLNILVFIISYRTFKKREKYEEKLIKLLIKDELTGVDNYNKFLIELDMIRKNNKENLVVICFDIKNFKFINKIFGYSTGDAILKQIAENISKYIIGDYRYTRINNDLFAIAIIIDREEFNIEDFVKIIRNKILVDKIHKEILKSNDLQIKPSIGIYFVDEEHQDVKVLIDYANLARQKNKELNNAEYYVFKLETLKEKEESIIIERNIYKGLRTGEFEVYYQPKVCPKSNAIVGVEALIRWFSKKNGFIGPDIFIPIAEKSGHIRLIGKWVLEQVCKDLSEWREKDYNLIPVSINISKVELYQSDLISDIKQTLKTYEIDPSLIELEITETTALNDIKYINEKIKLLKELGIKVSMDDFGTGTSTLSNLKNIYIDTLKIDRSLLIDIEKEKKNEYMIESIIELSKKLGYKVVCEGIESQEQVDILKTMECDMIQGYVFYKPMNSKDLEAIIKKL
ncbi:MAG: bifunctional diguanylate cyclase/phosphodiesterase [Peptostreptococcaceae bacterium]